MDDDIGQFQVVVLKVYGISLDDLGLNTIVV